MNNLHPPSRGVGSEKSGTFRPHSLLVLRRLWIPLLVSVLALLVLAVGAPAWAASAPDGVEQGTVPPPPPGGGGGSNESEVPTATPTPFAPGTTPLPPAAEGTPVPPANYKGVVTAPRLNMRSGPGTAFSVVGQVERDQVLTLQYRDGSGTWWYSCCVSGTVTSGWVSSLFVRPEFDAAQTLALLPLYPNLPPAPAITPATTPAPVTLALPDTGARTGAVNAFRVNLRDQPAVTGAILGKLLEGEVVRVLSRNPAGDWWYVCCLAGTTTEGWASAEFITPSFDRARVLDLLPLYGQEVRAILPTPTPRPPKTAPASTGVLSVVPLTNTASITLTLPVTLDVAATTTLSLLMWQEPPFVSQGEPLALRFVISNTGAYTAAAVELRDELTATLALGAVQTANASQVSSSGVQTQDGPAATFSILWPQIAPSSAVTATVQLTVAQGLANGSVIPNIASVSARNAPAVTGGVSISLPPDDLPNFQ